jgi:hypothetical protein
LPDPPANELGRDLACGAERRIVEGGEIFRDGTTGRRRRQTRGTLDAIAVTGVGLDFRGASPTKEARAALGLMAAVSSLIGS